MSRFIDFTEEQKKQANATDLEHFLRSRGEKLLSSGRDKRMASDHSITIRGNAWYDHAIQQGGYAIRFVQRYYGLSYPDAVLLLLQARQTCSLLEDWEHPTPKPFILPPKHRDVRRVFAYLTESRGIDRKVISFFINEKLLYEEAAYHNAVFLGTDKDGIPRHAHKRSTGSFGKAFRQNVAGSDPRCSFHYLGWDERLYVFEAPIDLLSYITMYPKEWRQSSYVACCGTSFLPVEAMLSQQPNIKWVFLCLDHDRAGQSANQRMEEALNSRKIKTERYVPMHKDWNEDLLHLRRERREKCIPAHGSY